MPIYRRYSRKLILNIVKEKFFITIAFSKLGYLNITDLVCGVITIHVFRHRKGCFHCYAWHCRSLCHFEMKRLFKWFTGLEFTSGIISLSDIPSNLWDDFNSEAAPVFFTVADFLITIKQIKEQVYSEMTSRCFC